MKKTIGVFAHIDAGKTTFCEQLFYLGGEISACGRVDRGETLFDTHSIERERGVTVFAKQGRFCHGEDEYVLIDTPGHADFGAEAQRVTSALDAAIVLVDAPSGVRPQTRLLFSMLERAGKPCFFFINKTDMPNVDWQKTYAQIRTRLSENAVLTDLSGEGIDALLEEAALRDEDFMTCYLDGEADEEALLQSLQKLVRERAFYPVFYGSALTGEGVETFLSLLDRLLVTEYDASAPLSARIFRISCQGQPTAFLKVEAGSIGVRDAFCFAEQTQKISGVRLYQADRFASVTRAYAGDTAAVTGLSFAQSGMVLQEGVALYAPSPDDAAGMRAGVEYGAQDVHAVLAALRTLEREDPALDVQVDEDTGACSVAVMGQMQMEVLSRILHDRFSLEIAFGAPRAAFAETIERPVIGIGHFEPLRHYAEVMLAIVPAPRGSGVTFESRCHVDALPLSYQSAIEGALLSRRHRGVRMGAPLTDVRLILLEGGVHEKHTEGGDLRQAAWRAVRQGLEKAQGVLLEPFYRFEISVPTSLCGRVLTDVQMMGGQCDAPVTNGDEAIVYGRAGARALNGYAQVLSAASGGKSAAAMRVDGRDLCPDAAQVLQEAGYDPSMDREHTSCSVFCKKGAGYTVSPREADTLSHLRQGRSDEQILAQYGL